MTGFTIFSSDIARFHVFFRRDFGICNIFFPIFRDLKSLPFTDNSFFRFRDFGIFHILADISGLFSFFADISGFSFSFKILVFFKIFFRDPIFSIFCSEISGFFDFFAGISGFEPPITPPYIRIYMLLTTHLSHFATF